jgi:putrescine---pyruvate transaminase
VFEDDTVKAISRRMVEHGVLSSAIGTSVEIAPPLTMTEAEFDTVVSVYKASIDEVSAERRLA